MKRVTVWRCCVLLVLCVNTTPMRAATGAPQLQTELDKTVYGVFNEPFQLACSAPGYDVAIAWYRDQVPISVLNPGMPTTERVAVASNGSLLFTPLELSDSGWYTCTASNTFGRDEIDFLLFVRAPPKIVFMLTGGAPLLAVQVQEGTRVELPCRYSGTPYPNLKWFRDDQEIIDGDANNRFRIDPTTGSLVIFNVTDSEMAVFYHCNVSESNDFQIGTPVAVDLFPPPTAALGNLPSAIGSSDQTSISIAPNEMYNLSCVEITNAQAQMEELEFRWFNDKKKLMSLFGQRSIIVGGGMETGSGYYCCEVKQNGTQLVNNYCITVVVRRLGSISNVPLNTSLQEGRTVNLFCSGSTANNFDLPVLEWTYGNGDVILDKPGTKVENGIGFAYVRIENIQAADEGTYTCVGMNFAGTVHKSIDVMVTDRCSDNDTKLVNSNAETETSEGWEFEPGAMVAQVKNEWVFRVIYSAGGTYPTVSQTVGIPSGTICAYVSGRMRTSSDGTPVIKLTATTGETLQLTPPYLSNVQGWQWVGDKMVINGEDGGTLTVELTILAPVGQDVSGTAFFDDICVTFEVVEESSSDSKVDIIIIVAAGGAGLIFLFLVLLCICILCCCCCCKKKKSSALPMKKMSTIHKTWTWRHKSKGEQASGTYSRKRDGGGEEAEVVYEEVSKDIVRVPSNQTSPHDDDETYYIQTVDSIPNTKPRGSSAPRPIPPRNTQDLEYQAVSYEEQNYSIASLHALPAPGPNEYLQVLPPNNEYIQLLAPSSSSPTMDGESPKPQAAETSFMDPVTG